MSFLSFGWLVLKIAQWWRMRRMQKACAPERVVRFAHNPVSFGAQVKAGKQAVIVHALMLGEKRRLFMLRYDSSLKMFMRDGDGFALFAVIARTPCGGFIPHHSVSEILHALSVYLMRGDAEVVTLIFGHPHFPSRKNIEFIDVVFAEIEPIEIDGQYDAENALVFA